MDSVDAQVSEARRRRRRRVLRLAEWVGVSADLSMRMTGRMMTTADSPLGDFDLLARTRRLLLGNLMIIPMALPPTEPDGPPRRIAHSAI